MLSGDDTGGRFTLIDMYVPPGGGPPPHRHDFEETFIVTEGQLDVAFRGTRSAGAGTTINVPANAPHQFRNSSGQPARLLCLCAPPGQEEFFAAVWDRVPDRTSPPPGLDAPARAAHGQSPRTGLPLPDGTAAVLSAFQFAAALVILAILAIVQVVTRTPNDQIGIARALLGSEPTSAQIGGTARIIA